MAYGLAAGFVNKVLLERNHMRTKHSKAHVLMELAETVSSKPYHNGPNGQVLISLLFHLH